MEEILFDNLQPTSLGIRDLAQVYPEMCLWSCLFIRPALKQPVIWHSIKSQIICFNWHCPEAFGKIRDPFFLASHSGQCSLKCAVSEGCQMVMESSTCNAVIGRATDLRSWPRTAMGGVLAQERNIFWKMHGTTRSPSLLHLSLDFNWITSFPQPQKAVHGCSPRPATCEDLSKQDSNVLFFSSNVLFYNSVSWFGGAVIILKERRGWEGREKERATWPWVTTGAHLLTWKLRRKRRRERTQLPRDKVFSTFSCPQHRSFQQETLRCSVKADVSQGQSALMLLEGTVTPLILVTSHTLISLEPRNAASIYNCHRRPGTFWGLSLFCKNKYVLMGSKVHWPVDVSALF